MNTEDFNDEDNNHFDYLNRRLQATRHLQVLLLKKLDVLVIKKHFIISQNVSSTSIVPEGFKRLTFSYKGNLLGIIIADNSPVLQKVEKILTTYKTNQKTFVWIQKELKTTK